MQRVWTKGFSERIGGGQTRGLRAVRSGDNPRRVRILDTSGKEVFEVRRVDCATVREAKAYMNSL